MAGGGQTSGAQLKPELRLKIYNEAIRHFEKAKTLRAQGRTKDALHELHKATKVVRAFPEVYDLARQIYLEMENEEEADKQAELFKNYGGNEGVSLYRLREDVARVVRARKKMARPPDFSTEWMLRNPSMSSSTCSSTFRHTTESMLAGNSAKSPGRSKLQ